MSVRVRYLAGMGRPKGPAIQPGDVRDVDSDEAERLIERGLAEPAKGESLKSAADEHEKAMAKTRGGRSRKTSTKASKKAAKAEKATA